MPQIAAQTPPLTAHDRLLIIDFGSQVTQLIARRLRELNVYCEIHPFQKVTDTFLQDFAPKAVIFSGGPASVFAEGAPMPPASVFGMGVPILGICRGFQELNVVLGGTLETELQKGEGRLDHRARKVPDLDIRYGPSHKIAIRPGGMLERILGKRETMINSIHRQGVRMLAPGLEVEATAPDGIIEAASVKGAKSFAFGTQWHPEYKAWENPDSVKLFEAYGDAVRACVRHKTEPHPERNIRVA